MPYKTIQNSNITNGQKCEILTPYIKNTKDKLYKKTGSMNSGLQINNKEAYSITTGVVTSVLKDKDTYTVVVKFDGRRYGG